MSPIAADKSGTFSSAPRVTSSGGPQSFNGMDSPGVKGSLRDEQFLVADASMSIVSQLPQYHLDSVRPYRRVSPLELTVEPTDPALRAVMTSLHLAKKDKNLLDSFIIHSEGSGFLSSEKLREVLRVWMGQKMVDERDLDDLLRLAELEDSDSTFNFEQVAKLACVLSTFSRSGKDRPKKLYHNMQSTKSRVTYNIMGEKVFLEKKNLGIFAEGISKGQASEIRRLLAKLPARVNSLPTAHPQYPKTLLSTIPTPYLPLIYRNIEFPDHWRPTDEHWFDLRRY